MRTGRIAPLLLGACLVGAGCGRTAAGRAATPPPSAARSAVASSSVAARPSSSSAAPTVAPSSSTAPAAGLANAVAVVIDNAPQARPQSGLEDANIVWEILAEGFITRFLAIYVTHQSAQIGPVRSARIYFDQLDRAYGLPFAHAGGNVDALNEISAWHLQNLDQIYGSGPYFWRSGARQAPHNLYTSTTLLQQGIRNDGYHGPYPTLPVATPAAAGAKATSSVSLNYLTDPPVYTYVAGWIWQGSAWVRTVNGAVQHMLDGDTVQARTVYILVVRTAPDPDPYTPGSIKMLWSEGGKAWVLQDGTRVSGTWRLGSDGLPQISVAGRPAGSGGGPYWYELVPSAGEVSFH